MGGSEGCGRVGVSCTMLPVPAEGTYSLDVTEN